MQQLGIKCRFFPVSKSGLSGYMGHVSALNKVLRAWRPDVIHAHYGLCGLLANLQRIVPVITTYHGSDINYPRILRLSRIAIRLSAFNIFVSQKNVATARPKGRFAVIPCGINLKDYPLIDKESARSSMGLSQDKKYILFAGAFDNKVKNYPLAQTAVNLLSDAELIELKGYTREQVATLMQAVDALLMTSHTEGSPQVIKEAMACGCPIVSVDVGDVKERIDGLGGCYLAERTPEDLSQKIKAAIAFGNRTEGKKLIESSGLTNEFVARKILDVYNEVARR